MVDNPKRPEFFFWEEKGEVLQVFFSSLPEFCSVSGTNTATYRARPRVIKRLISVFPTPKKCFPRF